MYYYYNPFIYYHLCCSVVYANMLLHVATTNFWMHLETLICINCDKLRELKEIITATLLGYLIIISTDIVHLISPISPLFWVQLRSYIKHLRQCFIVYPGKHLEFYQKYSAACHVFNSLLSVKISQWNTVCCVWCITSTWIYKSSYTANFSKKKK